MTIHFLLFVLSTVGMAHIIVDGSILQWLRDFVKTASNAIKIPKLGGVVDCYMCCGTWTGFLMGWVWLTFDPWQIFACGCAGGFLANFAAVLLNWVESQTVLNFPQDNHMHTVEAESNES